MGKMGSRSRGSDILGVAVLATLMLLTAMLYWPALGGPLLLDDSTVITPLLQAAERGQDWRNFLFSDSGPLGRPVAMASFIANAMLSVDLRYWKATNLAVHLINGALIYALFTALARVIQWPAPRARVLALGGTALWLLHPLHVSTVMYLCQRMTGLATLFGLLALLLYVYGRQRVAAGRGGVSAIACALCIATPLAALSKEIGCLTPFYLVAVEICVFSSANGPRPRWLRLLLLTVTVLPVAVAALYFLTHWQTSFVGPYSLREFGPLERLMTEARVLLVYLGWIVVPRRAALGFFHDDFAIASWPPNLVTGAALVALISMLLLAWRGRRRAPLAALGVLLFFAGHALESSVFALELVFEHRNYLPAIGICLLLAAASVEWLDTRRATLLLGTLALLYGLVTASITPSWGNEGALYSSFIEAHPDSRRARATVIEWLLGRGDVNAASAALGDASDVAAQLHRLRIACVREQRGDTAGNALRAAAGMARPDDMSVEILLWLASQVLDGACALDADALAGTIEALRDRPLSSNSRVRLYMISAQLRHTRGEHEQAALAAAYAARLVPRDPYPLYLGVEIALDAGDVAAARTLLDAARLRARQQPVDFSRIDAGLEAQLTGAPPRD